jgi:glutathione synthase/RimK-type ligase-like ATP-grasp enzyme
MLLIFTDEFDSHVDYTLPKLIQSGIPFFRLNLNVAALKTTQMTFFEYVWTIKTKEGNVSNKEISCVWCRRPFVELMLEEQDIQDTDFKIWKNEWNKTLLGLYNSLSNVKWLNPLRKAYKGENKYYQMTIADQIGFKLPEMIVTNDKQKLIDFALTNEPVVLKLMSQEIYNDNNTFKGFYVNKILAKDLADFENYGENPIVLQKYIQKAYEVRYTVVGKKHFVCRIESQKSNSAKEDWRRYDIPNTPHVEMDPPQYIKDKVDKFLDVLQIEYGALDFIVTPDNEWIFLEINCMGQWLWIENLTGLKISDAIVEWISNILNKKEKG